MIKRYLQKSSSVWSNTYAYTTLNILTHFFLPFLAVGAVNEYLFGNYPSDFKNGIISVFLYISFVCLSKKTVFIRKGSKTKNNETAIDVSFRYIHNIAVFAAIFIAVVFCIGTSLYNTNSLAPIIGSFSNFLSSMLYTVGAAYILYLLIRYVLVWFKGISIVLPNKNEWNWFGGNVRSLLLWWAIIFACWVPAFLAYFPGIFSYDVFRQLWQLGGLTRINNELPVLHTFFVWVTYTIGGTNQDGVMVYSIVQMALMSLIFSYVLYCLAKMKTHFIIRIIALAWFGLSPFNAIFALVQNHDVLLAGVLLLCVVTLMDFVSDPDTFLASKTKMIRLVVFLVLFALLRNNALYSLIIAAIAAPFIFIKYKIHTIKLFGSAAVIAWVLASPVSSQLGWDSILTGEALSVPAQQIALVTTRHWDDFNEWEQQTINRVFPMNVGHGYNPRLADPIKHVLTYENLDYFWRLWFHFLPRYPVLYAEAFLTLNLPLWFPDAAYPDQFSQRQYIEDGIIEWGGFGIERQSRLPWLLEHYESFARNESILQRLPVLRVITSIGTPIWVIFSVVLMILTKKKRVCIIPLLLPITLWFTFIFGPVSNVRYMYPLIAAYPLYLAVIVMAVAKAPEKIEARGANNG